MAAMRYAPVGLLLVAAVVGAVSPPPAPAGDLGPGGDVAVFGDHDAFQVYDVASGKRGVRVPAGAKGGWAVTEPALSPNGRFLAVGRTVGTEREVAVHDLRTGARRAVPAPEHVRDRSYSVAVDDGGRLVAVVASSRVDVLDLAAGRPRFTFEERGHVVSSVSFGGPAAAPRLAVVLQVLEAFPPHYLVEVQEVRGPGRWRTARSAPGLKPLVAPRGDLVALPTAAGLDVLALAPDDRLILRARLPGPGAEPVRFAPSGRWLATRVAARHDVVSRVRLPEGKRAGEARVETAFSRAWQALRDDGALVRIGARGAEAPDGECRPLNVRPAKACRVLGHHSSHVLERYEVGFK